MSRARIALTVVLAALLCPAGASAASDWIAAVNFPVPGNAFGGQLEARYQNGGIATETFLEVPSLSPLKTVLHIGTVSPGGSYVEQLTIPSSAGAVPTGAQIAVAPNGAAVATWVELTGATAESPYRYRAAYRPANSNVWEAPFTIATDSEYVKGLSNSLTAVIGSDGTAAVGVQHVSSATEKGLAGEPIYRLEVAMHPAGGPWQAPVRINPAGESGEALALGLDGQGDLTAAFTQRFSEGGSFETDRYTVIVRRRPASSGVWGPSEDITKSEITWTADALHLAENDAGDAVVSYQYVSKIASSLDVWAVTRQGPNGSWTTPAHVVTGSSAPESVGVAPDGMAYVLYSFQGASSGESCEGVLRAPAGGAFTAQHCASPPNEDTFSGSVAFIGNDAYFAWKGNVPGESSNGMIQGARWPDASTLPEVARNLDPAGTPYGSPTLVSDDQGSVVAFYTNQANQLRAAAYDAGPPILLGSGVPSSAIVGQPVTFAASFIDLWSGLGGGQPTWSFGDGASASGASVTHVFAKHGAYTVTLTATDALGNATSSTHLINVVSVIPPARHLTVTLNLPACPRKMSKKACKRRRASRSAWRALSGQVADPGFESSIVSVKVAVYRTSGKRLEGLAGKRFRKTTLAKARSTFVSAKVSAGRWTLRLPKLKAGRYTILVRATDSAGGASPTLSKTVALK